MSNYYNCSGVDTHMHTIGSGHAFNTYKEMVDEACRKRLDVICITEHGCVVPESMGASYIRNMRVITRDTYPHMIGNVIQSHGKLKVIHGYEANILNAKGDTDFELLGHPRMHLKYVIGSIHTAVYADSVSDPVHEFTNAYINTCKHPYIMALGHIDDDNVPCNFEAVIKAAKENNVLIEANNSSLTPESWRKNSEKNMLEYLALCKELEATIVLGSDAHWADDIGRFNEVKRVLSRVDFPEELIINRDKDIFLKWLDDKIKVRDEVMTT